MVFKTDAFYPTISTDRFEETVQFYSRHFGFTPTFEEDGFAVLQQNSENRNFLGVVRKDHPALTDDARDTSASGTILRFFVENADLAYQQLAWEGASIAKEVSRSDCGMRYLVARDPNGIILHITEDTSNIRIPQFTRTTPPKKTLVA